MEFTKKHIWETRGSDNVLRTFVAYEHTPTNDPNTRAPITHTLDVVTENGPREVGGAISLMDAHALSRVFRGDSN